MFNEAALTGQIAAVAMKNSYIKKKCITGVQ